MGHPLIASGSANTTSLICADVIACAEINTICARRHVTTDPDVRRTIHNSRFLIARDLTRPKHA